ncbi:DUF2953 domain-containing protein [uncultured Methanobacterium sp.]|uniref:DUF2953 domain-containing protein n=1 Tax=uncultured Methanobacterium sp. TaxID=176306 RepID=UPI002AA7FED4|nr:DUF2953 domain-containing protein [uncultured Methanobacterium sp.]
MSFLLIPLKLSLSFKKQGSEIYGQFSLKFLGIRIFSRNIPEDEKDKAKKEDDKEEKTDEEDKFNLKRILKILNLVKESWPHIYRLITACYRSVSLEKFSLKLTLGMESPADTALFTGYIWSFTYPLNAITRIDAVITPDFDRRVLDGDLEVDVSLKLIWIVVEVLRAFTKKPVRELIGEMRR